MTIDWDALWHVMAVMCVGLSGLWFATRFESFTTLRLLCSAITTIGFGLWLIAASRGPSFPLLWIGVMHLMVTGPALCLIVLWFGLRRRTAKIGRIGVVLCAFGTLPVFPITYAMLIEPRWIEVESEEIFVLPHNSNDRVRVVVLADIQTPRFGMHERRTLAPDAGLEHDMILLRGDLLQRGRTHVTWPEVSAAWRYVTRAHRQEH